MKHFSINIEEKIKKILPKKLEKDLTDNEIICPVCDGLGLMKKDHKFAIKDDIINKLNWYDNEYITFCPACYFGVIKTCEFCGKPFHRGNYRCNCQGYKEDEKRREYEKRQERISMAFETTLDKVSTYLYDDENDRYYAEIEDFVDEVCEDYICGDATFWNSFEEYLDNTLPEILWVTEYVEMSMDASDIIYAACEELHEDAMDNISYDDKNELQDYLDNWCKKQTGTGTYYPCYIKYVRVKKEWFNEEV